MLVCSSSATNLNEVYTTVLHGVGLAVSLHEAYIYLIQALNGLPILQTFCAFKNHRP